MHRNPLSLFAVLPAPAGGTYCAAPNAIAYQSNEFTALEVFRASVPASAILVLVISIFVWKIWPWMGMPVIHWRRNR